MTTPPPAIPNPTRRPDRAAGPQPARAADDRFEAALQRHSAGPGSGPGEQRRVEDEGTTGADRRLDDPASSDRDEGSASAAADSSPDPSAASSDQERTDPAAASATSTTASAAASTTASTNTSSAAPVDGSTNPAVVGSVAGSTSPPSDDAVPAAPTVMPTVTSTTTSTTASATTSATTPTTTPAVTPTTTSNTTQTATSSTAETPAVPGATAIDATSPVTAAPSAGGESPMPGHAAAAPGVVADEDAASTGAPNDATDTNPAVADEVTETEMSEGDLPDPASRSNTRLLPRTDADGQLPRSPQALRADVVARTADAQAARSVPEVANADDLLAQAELRRVTASGRRLDVGIATHDLGTVRVEAIDRGAGLQLHLSSDQAGGRAHLGAHLAELRADLAERGVDVGSLDVGDAPADHRRQDEPSGRSGPSAASTAEPTDPQPSPNRPIVIDGVDLRL